MGQGLGLNSGRVHKFYGHKFTQNLKVDRRGVVGTQNESMGPTVVVRITHQSGGDGLMHRGGLSPATLFGVVWSPQENSKKYNKHGTLKTSWGVVNPQSFKVLNPT